MFYDEDLPALVADGVAVVFGTVTTSGVYRKGKAAIFNDGVEFGAVQESVTIVNGSIGTFAHDAAITVDGRAYTILDDEPAHGGAMTRLILGQA